MRFAMKILIIGYGNPGRLDDGLGPAFAERFQTLETVGAGDDRAHGTRLQNVQGLEEEQKPSCNDFQRLENRTAGILPALTIESNYQLNVEDAAQIAEHDVVIFADASTDAEPPFEFNPLEPAAGGLSFSSHSVSAPQLMGMVRELFHAEPQAYMLAIRGYEFNGFGETLSEKAKQNLDAAVEFLSEWLISTPEIPNDGRNDEARKSE
jgi:hydrogenase maturation protease